MKIVLFAAGYVLMWFFAGVAIQIVRMV